MDIFYEKVKKLVKERTKLTLRDFIESLGINYETYNSTRRYHNLPRADESVKIAQALGVSVEYLVTGTEPGNAAPVEKIQSLARQILDETGKIK
jgi:transcriptional regulator with XRE-family HTH domain